MENICKNFEVIQDPENTLSGFEREKLVDKLTEIANDGFGTEKTKEDVGNHVMKVDALYLIKEDEEIIGFSSYDFINFQNKVILFLHGIVVKRDYQKNGIFYETNKKVLDSGNFDILAMRTQNPVIYAATSKLVEILYPNLGVIPEDMKELANTLANDFLGMDCFDGFVGRGTYGECLYDEVPRHDKSDKFFDDVLGLDYIKGDSVVLVGVVK